ncbi:hypothetical protein ACHAQH_001427 [Verticillium albo-atrum]
MFGSFPAIASLPRVAKIDPKDIPPPTPVVLPHSQPQLHSPPSPPASSAQPLVHFIQTVYRPGQVAPPIFKALGVHVIPEIAAADLLPDPAYLPDFAAWNALSADEARQRNDETKRPLNTGVQSPGCQTYQDRKRELSISNDDAYRVVRRLPPLKGQQQARLGNAYEFYRCLEAFTTFWDDTSRSPSAAAAAAPSTDESPEGKDAGEKHEEASRVVRTAAGTSIPGDYRQNLVNAFLKLVAYDFGCNASAPRAEPRLHMLAPSASSSSKKRGSSEEPARRSSYFASGCTFIFRSPRTRDAARQGLVDGPLSAVSARASTTFDTEADHNIDFAREIVAALITAQHRAREGKTERRPGDGQWWTTQRRWGGGQGGPIGREVDRDVVAGDKDAAPANEKKAEQATAALTSSSSSSSYSAGSRPGSAGMPVSKRPRKQMSVYDNYRMVRPPSASWDHKTRYEAIGKVRGAGYDDIFVVSCLFHHVSILRVRVPDRLLEVLGGAADEIVGGERSWGKLEVRRSRWFDLFLVDERVAAMEMVWGIMAWMMRAPEQEESSKREDDVKMAGT